MSRLGEIADIAKEGEEVEAHVPDLWHRQLSLESTTDLIKSQHTFNSCGDRTDQGA